MKKDSKVIVAEFESYEKTIRKIFDALGDLKNRIKEEKIVIKPNLTINLLPPVTTSVECVEAILKEILRRSIAKDRKIIVAEGSGGCDTLQAFKDLGYEKLRREFNIELIDLNRAERVELRNEKALKLKSMLFPSVLLNSFLINVPVPKEHSSAIITNSLKNMFGIYLSKGYLAEWNMLRRIGVVVARKIFSRGWSKCDLHVLGVHESIYDINLYKKPDLTICDARIGQMEQEIDGKPCIPAINKIFASYDPVAIDSYVAKLFGHDWKNIKYLVYANGKLGNAEDFDIIEI